MEHMSEEKLSYGRYLKIPELLGLQNCLTYPPHHDEPLFIIVHQVYELWFKQMLHEIDTAMACLGDDRVQEAIRLLRRTVEIQELLVQQVRILETMRPQDFIGFRYHLNPASGFQSVQFRELEFVLGMKDPAVLASIVCRPEESVRLQARLADPTLGDVFDDLLLRRGFRKDPPPTPAPDGRSQSEEWRLAALVAVYENPEDHPELVSLAEVLVDVDEALALWRGRHVQMVERMIGAKRGTGGSDGVGYLRTTLPKRAFPDLWRVRTHIGQEPR
jgi:tryptophan 2,3-dioxygenase